MSIKLYKSSLTPTIKDSNVADTRQISLAEAQAPAKALKGMLHSGEKLYVKHLDIKSDNELIEKSKEIMNGTDNFEGLSATIIKAKEMKDGDKALELYENKKYEDARFMFERNIVFNPKDSKSYLYLAKIYNHEKDKEKGKEGKDVKSHKSKDGDEKKSKEESKKPLLDHTQ